MNDHATITADPDATEATLAVLADMESQVTEAVDAAWLDGNVRDAIERVALWSFRAGVELGKAQARREDAS